MGDVVISLDVELAWGYHDHPTAPRRMPAARSSWVGALELFDRYDVPATWAIVGHLFLQSCDGTHAEHPLAPAWFENDPGGSLETDGLWYGSDLLEELLASDTGHEIASHSFSHVEMGAPTTNEAVANAELEACVDAADRRGVSLDSFVFPRNDVGHREALGEHGFGCYRGTKPPAEYEDSRFRQLLKVADWSLGGESPPIVTPVVDEYGLVNVPASLYLFSFEGVARDVLGSVWDRPVVTVAKRGIDRVCDEDGVFHMWLHPHNLLQPQGFERMAAILSYLSERRAEGALEVKTMREVAAECVDRPLRPRSEVIA